MTKRHFIFSGFCVLLLNLFSSCRKEKTVDPAPVISFESISPGQVKEYQDAITIVLAYQDSDGDLGENTPSAKNVFITDSRNGITYEYRLNQLAPDNSTIAIKGKVNVVLNNTAITDGSASQSYTYSLYVKDRAGHSSAPVTTTAITVVK